MCRSSASGCPSSSATLRRWSRRPASLPSLQLRQARALDGALHFRSQVALGALAVGDTWHAVRVHAVLSVRVAVGLVALRRPFLPLSYPLSDRLFLTLHSFFPHDSFNFNLGVARLPADSFHFSLRCHLVHLVLPVPVVVIFRIALLAPAIVTGHVVGVGLLLGRLQAGEDLGVQAPQHLSLLRKPIRGSYSFGQCLVSIYILHSSSQLLLL